MTDAEQRATPIAPRPELAIDAATLAALPPARLSALLDGLEPIETAMLFHDWRFWARPSQLPPAVD